MSAKYIALLEPKIIAEDIVHDKTWAVNII